MVKNLLDLCYHLLVEQNVVETGKEISKKIELLKEDLPHGIEIEKVYYQPELVSTAINQFIINLIESVVVVVGVLLITMGIKSGLIIGSGLYTFDIRNSNCYVSYENRFTKSFFGSFHNCDGNAC